MSGMTLKVDEIKNSVVFHLGGRVMYERDSLVFRHELDQALSQGKQKIILDLSEVTAMSSTGLGILIAAYRVVKDKGGTLKLAQLSVKVRSILETTRLISIFEVFDNLDDAMKKV
ncbi:MAG: STAS domain-containing protein [bacterium]|nr:STAS domain-containing protein [bacterium]